MKFQIFTRNVHGYSFSSPLSYIPGESGEPRVPFIDRRVWYKQRTRRAHVGCRLINGPRELWTSKPAHKCVPCVHILLYVSGSSETTSPKHRIQCIAFLTSNISHPLFNLYHHNPNSPPSKPAHQ